MPEKKKKKNQREKGAGSEGTWVGRGGAGGDELSDLRRSNS